MSPYAAPPMSLDLVLWEIGVAEGEDEVWAIGVDSIMQSVLGEWRGGWVFAATPRCLRCILRTFSKLGEDEQLDALGMGDILRGEVSCLEGVFTGV